MTQEDIVSMAREAGIKFQSNTGITGRIRVTTCGSQSIATIERLVELARADEREACAKVADRYVGADPIADAIRARGNT